MPNSGPDACYCSPYQNMFQHSSKCYVLLAKLSYKNRLVGRNVIDIYHNTMSAVGKYEKLIRSTKCNSFFGNTAGKETHEK